MERTKVVVSMGFARRVSPSSRHRQTSAPDPKGCAGPGVPAKSRWWGADFVGWGGARNVSDSGRVLEGGARPPLPSHQVRVEG